MKITLSKIENEIKKNRINLVYIKKDILKDILFNYFHNNMYYQSSTMDSYELFTGLTLNDIFNDYEKTYNNPILSDCLDRYGHYLFETLSQSKQMLIVNMFHIISYEKVMLFNPLSSLTLDDSVTLIRFIKESEKQIIIESNDLSLIDHLDAPFMVIGDEIEYYTSKEILQEAYTIVSIPSTIKQSFNYQNVILHKINQSTVYYYFNEFKDAQQFYDEVRNLCHDTKCYITSESVEGTLRRIYEL